jgi:hypothetical protein
MWPEIAWNCEHRVKVIPWRKWEDFEADDARIQGEDFASYIYIEKIRSTVVSEKYSRQHYLGWLRTVKVKVKGKFIPVLQLSTTP